MEDHKGNGVNKITFALVLLFLMIIALMIGFGISYHNNKMDGMESSSMIAAEEEKGAKNEGNDLSVFPKLSKTKVLSEEMLNEATDLSEIAEETLPSLVAITSQSVGKIETWFGTEDRVFTGSGSGVIFDQDENSVYILTAYSVVEGAKSLSVMFNDGERANGTVKGSAEFNDLSVIEVKKAELKKSTLSKIKLAKLGSSKKMKVGEMVIAIGNALGFGQSFTAGHVSAKDREAEVNGYTLKLLQTDVAINFGNFGGALLNLKGEVIGINTLKYATRDVKGMGYAVPIDIAKPLAEDLKDYKEIKEEDRGYLGVYYKEVDDALNEEFGLPYGLYVNETVPGGGAEKAGILPGDIIISVNGFETLKSGSINSIIIHKRIGDKVKVRLKRNENGEYAEKEVEVTLSSGSKFKKEDRPRMKEKEESPTPIFPLP